MTFLLPTIRTFSVWPALLAGVPLMAFDAGCARTPQLAVTLARSVVAEQVPLNGSGYKVQSLHYDPVLNRQWAVIASCEHPGSPTFAVPLNSPIPNSSGAASVLHDAAPAVVHAGEVIQAWQQGANLRIEVAGRAEESGAIGSRIRIRVLRTEPESGEPLTVTGIVRGRGNVEIGQ